MAQFEIVDQNGKILFVDKANPLKWHLENAVLVGTNLEGINFKDTVLNPDNKAIEID